MTANALCVCREGNKVKNGRMNDKERRLWILNDEGMYRWYRHAHKGISTFIRENRIEIDQAIRQALGERYSDEKTS